MNKLNDEMLPCGKCGAKGRIARYNSLVRYDYYYTPECTDEDCDVETSRNERIRTFGLSIMALEFWNKKQLELSK